MAFEPEERSSPPWILQGPEGHSLHSFFSLPFLFFFFFFTPRVLSSLPFASRCSILYFAHRWFLSPRVFGNYFFLFLVRVIVENESRGTDHLRPEVTNVGTLSIPRGWVIRPGRLVGEGLVENRWLITGFRTMISYSGWFDEAGKEMRVQLQRITRWNFYFALEDIDSQINR